MHIILCLPQNSKFQTSKFPEKTENGIFPSYFRYLDNIENSKKNS